MKTRETMMNNLINRFGHEHPWIIKFCEFCDTWSDNDINNKGLNDLYNAMMVYKETTEEEE